MPPVYIANGQMVREQRAPILERRIHELASGGSSQIALSDLYPQDDESRAALAFVMHVRGEANSPPAVFVDTNLARRFAEAVAAKNLAPADCERHCVAFVQKQAELYLEVLKQVATVVLKLPPPYENEKMVFFDELARMAPSLLEKVEDKRGLKSELEAAGLQMLQNRLGGEEALSRYLDKLD